MSIKTIANVAIRLAIAGLLFAAPAEGKTCKQTSDAGTVCIEDLNHPQQVIKGCRKDGEGRTICPDDLLH